MSAGLEPGERSARPLLNAAAVTRPIRMLAAIDRRAPSAPDAGLAAPIRRRALPAPRLLRDRTDAWLLAALWVVAFAVRAAPVLRGGGILGLQGYDDGVYFGTAMALVHGVIPYRDFVLLLPPGIALVLAPFAMVGSVIGDPAAFALARLSFIGLGATNAVLVALIAGRYGRAAGLFAGAIYAVWETATLAERSTDLHAPQTTFVLLAFFALTRPGRIGPGRAALAGIALGLATSIQLWQGLTVLVLLWWVFVRGRGHGWSRLRSPLACAVGAGLSFLAVCLPFVVAAPAASIRQVLVDQLGRPGTGIGTFERLRVLLGLPPTGSPPIVLTRLAPDALVLVAVLVGLAIVVGTAWRYPWTRPWAVLAVIQSAFVIVTPSFIRDYPSLASQAAALVLGTAGAAMATVLARRRGWRVPTAVLVVALIGGLAAISVAHRSGGRLQLEALTRDVAEARCVTTDSPSLLVLTGAMRRNLERGCAVVLDPTGVSYDTDRGWKPGMTLREWRLGAPGYQRAMTAWYTSGDAALFSRLEAASLAPATEAAIRDRLPVEVRRRQVLVRLAEEP